MRKIDAVDRQILQILQSDGRIPYTEIASRLGLSEGTIRSRIARLLQEGVFEFVIRINPEKLGLHVQSIIGINTRPGMQKRVAEALCEFEEIKFVGAFTGRHDLVIHAWFACHQEVNTFVEERLAQIDGIVSAEVSVELRPYKDVFSRVRSNEAYICERG